MKKKHELLKYAYDNYPKGTKFIGTTGFNPIHQESTGDLGFSVDGERIINFPVGKGIVYDSETNKWAEIVNPKLAVKVENEKEFNDLMKYYKSIGRKLNNGDNPTGFVFEGFDVIFVDIEDLSFIYDDEEAEGYKIITFYDFAKEHNIQLPLLTTEDGVNLYEGDEFVFVNNAPKEGYYVNDYHGKMYELSIESLCFKYPEKYKVFSTKQAALDWIEAQKPKEFIFDDYTTILKDRVKIRIDGVIHYLLKPELESILKTMQELS